MKWKAVIGIVLAVASLAALFLWETKFEDEITLSSVLVLAEDHAQGDYIDKSDLKVLKINPQAKLNNALTEKDVDQIVGKILKRDIVQKEQLLSSYFMSKEEMIPEGYIDFVIPSEWIYSKSSLVGVRDYATIYAMPQKELLGTYKIDVVGDKGVEILARLEDYYMIYDSVMVGENRLLIVMEDDL